MIYSVFKTSPDFGVACSNFYGSHTVGLRKIGYIRHCCWSLMPTGTARIFTGSYTIKTVSFSGLGG